MQNPKPHQNHHRRNKRRPPLTIALQPGHVAFRLVCHSSIVGGLIGRSGSVISQLRRETSCIIHCDDGVAGVGHRVIVVAGPGFPDRKITWKCGADDDVEEEEGDETMVSAAQEAVARVFERMWEVDAERDRRNNGCESCSVSEGYCGLLVNTTQVGAVVGRGGRNIVRMRRESGAHIRTLPPPQCAAKDDELIQITGAIVAVKKALIAVTTRLQDCPPYHKDLLPLARPVESDSYSASSDPHAEFFPHLSSLLPPLTENSANAYSSSTDVNREPKQEMEAAKQKVSFRLLCSNGAAGSIIGTKGTIVRTLQNETGASIMFAAPLTSSGERVVSISALENIESPYSPAQNAVILVFARSIEHDIQQGHLSGLIKGTTVTARLLVASDVVCCLSENGGKIDSEMIEVTGADIQILEGDKVMDDALKNDIVVQITGEYRNVQNALFQVTSKLRDNLFPSKVLNEVREMGPYGIITEIASPRLHKADGASLDTNKEAGLMRGMDQLGLSNKIDVSLSALQLSQKLRREYADNESSSCSTAFGGASEIERSLHFLLPREVLNEVGARSLNRGMRETNGLSLVLAPNSSQETILTRGNDRLRLSNNTSETSPALHLPQTVGRGHTMAIIDSEEGLTTFGRSVELGRKKSAVVANTTIELIVSEDILDFVCGEDGGQLARLREISGAKVEVRNPSPGTSEGMVVLSGTPDQTRAAQSLLEAFILEG